MCDNVIKNNNSSQKDAVEAYKVILQDLSELLKKEDISKEERDEITEKMILVADKISAKDTENKDFLNGIIKYGSLQAVSVPEDAGFQTALLLLQSVPP